LTIAFYGVKILIEYSFNKGAVRLPRAKKQFDAMRSATKEKIWKAGLQLFSHKGLAATSIHDIATQAGISVGLMYHYYKSKEDLFTELVEMAVGSAAEATQMLFESSQSPSGKIKIFSKEVIEDIAQSDRMSQLYLLMIHYTLVVGLPEKAAEIREKGFAPLESLKRTVIEGQKLGEVRTGDPDELVMMYFATIQGLAIAKLTTGDRFILPNPDLLSGLLLRTGTNTE
jgi:AcrR family transcriptional regulator